MIKLSTSYDNQHNLNIYWRSNQNDFDSRLAQLLYFDLCLPLINLISNQNTLSQYFKLLTPQKRIQTVLSNPAIRKIDFSTIR